MKEKKLKSLVTAALFTAIICIATFYIRFPLPAQAGYYNLGDCFVLLAGFLLSPVYGTLAAGLGSALADILSGYVQYAPATFVIKALMALAAYFIFRAMKKMPFAAKLLSGFAAEAVMVLGYFGYEAVILSYGISAAANILPNTIQGIIGIVSAAAVSTVIEKNKTLNSFFKR